MDIPIVLVDSYVDDDYFYKVRIDDELGGYLATNYLLQKGHRNIGLVSGMIIKDGVVEKRFQGYKRALKSTVWSLTRILCSKRGEPGVGP